MNTNRYKRQVYQSWDLILGYWPHEIIPMGGYYSRAGTIIVDSYSQCFLTINIDILGFQWDFQLIY